MYIYIIIYIHTYIHVNTSMNIGINKIIYFMMIHDEGVPRRCNPYGSNNDIVFSWRW